jgi:hypothetical protein
MPYVLVTTQIRLVGHGDVILMGKIQKLYVHIYSLDFRTKYELFQESGPTIVGDEFSDTELMSYLGAVKKIEPGNNL